MQITKSLLAAVLLMGTNVLAAPAPSEAVASLNERAAVDVSLSAMLLPVVKC